MTVNTLRRPVRTHMSDLLGFTEDNNKLVRKPEILTFAKVVALLGVHSIIADLGTRLGVR